MTKCNYKIDPCSRLVSPVRIERTTHSLKGCRSTTELRAQTGDIVSNLRLLF